MEKFEMTKIEFLLLEEDGKKITFEDLENIRQYIEFVIKSKQKNDLKEQKVFIAIW